ncbi:hypothetical protein BT69DRAFT_1322068 [Atractiella rhizophila]|nr:hypothetical protein BT69DRAFT_1322068 [Atractiella rhizophila]
MKGTRKGHRFQSSISVTSPQTVAELISREERTNDERAWTDEEDHDSPAFVWVNYWWRRFKEGFKDAQGILLICLAQVFSAGMNATAKYFAIYGMPAWELILLRMTITLAFTYTYMRYRAIPDPILGPKGIRLLLCLRGFFGFFGLFGTYYSVRYLSLSDATAITFLTPVLTALVSPFLLGEPFAKTAIWAGLLSIFGVLLIAKPTSLFSSDVQVELPPPTEGGEGIEEGEPLPDVTNAQRLSAVMVALLGVVGIAGVYISIRKIGKRASVLNFIVYFSMWSTLISIVTGIVTKERPYLPTSWPQWLLVLAISLQGFGSQFCLTAGLQRLKNTGVGTFFTYTNLLWALTFQRLFFHHSPDILSVLGSCVILTSALWVYISTNKEEKKEKESLLPPPADEVELLGSRSRSPSLGSEEREVGVRIGNEEHFTVGAKDSCEPLAPDEREDLEEAAIAVR